MGLVNSVKSATGKSQFVFFFFNVPFLYIKKKNSIQTPWMLLLELDWYDLDEEKYDFKSNNKVWISNCYFFFS